MRLSLLIAVVLAAVPFACAHAPPANESEDPEARLELGLAALADQDMVTARRHLQWVYNTYPSRPAGTYALLAMTAAELDPRNPTRSLETAAALSGELLHAPEAPVWSRPVGHTFQLLAMELAGNERMLRQAQNALAGSQIDGLALPARLEEVVAERDRLLGRVTTMEQEMGAVKKELDEKKAELERIKKTIKG